jgi:hypothetical protein
MNVIPFPSHRAQAAPLAFTIGARVDLRIGAIAAGIVRARGANEETFAYSSLTRLIRGARMAWRERGIHSGLALSLPRELHATLTADLLGEAANEAGCTRQLFSFELDERAIVDSGPELAEALRAQGWGVILRGDPECALPFGARARALYTELVLDCADAPAPFLALEGGDRTPLGQRLLSARAADITLTAEIVRSAAQARTLAIAGFDRGGGPFAEAGLR